MKCKQILCAVLLLVSIHAGAQQGRPAAADTAKVNAMIRQVKATISQDPALGLKMAADAKAFAEKIDYPVGVATAAKWMGNANFYLGQPENALLIWKDALKIFEAAGDKIGQSDLLGNIGAFYYHRGDEVKALNHHLRSLKIAESVNHKPGIASALNNIGSVYYMKEATYDKALRYYLMALPLCEELGDQAKIGAITVNMGNIYMRKKEDDKALAAFKRSLKVYASNPVQIPNVYISLGGLYLRRHDYKQALENYQLALDIARQTNNQLNIARSLAGKATVYAQMGDYKTAISSYTGAEKITKELNAVLELEGLYKDMAVAYAKIGDYAKAYQYQSSLLQVKDTLYNIETDKKLAGIQFDFDLEKKQNEINLLTKDKSIKELELKKQQTFNTGLAIVLGLIVVVVFILYRSYRIKAKVNVLLDKKNMEIERLVRNILPAEIASELRSTGKATPRNYEQVSVMFTDFKGFTSHADKLTPKELVTELGNCFMAFDDIIEKYGLEKIKTIGDAYMVAGGIPVPGGNHVFNMVKASLEIQDFVRRNNQKRKEAGLSPWEIRIGINVGPVVAGVVGKKKYAYDIWGSTVNIASRMESNGMPGQVNISAAFYELIKDRYACVYRGKIQAKNVGEIDMYLIDHELDQPSGFRSLEEVQRKAEVLHPEPTNLLQ
ncbi:MAG: tetratricopeptide repeat protein [Bacteroidota bacterium]|nr:tetratricopeptide repeat protein [Bacteroidota bacterium]